MRMRKRRHLEERLERCAAYQVERPEEYRGLWREKFFPSAREVRLEIGCGKGKFLAELAGRHPDILFLALEKVPEAMVMAMEKAAEQELSNVYFLCADAIRVEEYFAPGEVDRIYLNFSDPWVARRHHKRRLTYREFLAHYRRILRPGGAIHFKTDQLPLFEFSLREFEAADFRVEAVTRDLHREGVQGVTTEYEERFIAQGVKINRCEAYRDE